jgi:signal transduction histidine kinase
VLTNWRRLPTVQQDLLLAAAIAIGWVALLIALENSPIPPSNPDTSLVAGLFLTFGVATVRQFPGSSLAIVSCLYPAVYAAVAVGVFAQFGVGGFGQHSVSEAALQSELHLVPLLVVGYQAAACGVRVATCLFFTMGSLAALMVGLPTLAAIVQATIITGSSSPRLALLPSDLPQLVRYIDLSLFAAAETLVGGMVLLGANSLRRRSNLLLLEQRNAELLRLRAVEADKIAAAERTRIARDLHDVVSHHMSAVVIRAQAADRVADERPQELRAAVRWIAASGKEALTAMRETVRVLNTASAGGGATETAPVPDLADVARMGDRLKAVGVDVTMDLPALSRQLTSAAELTAVRIIQEALTNVMVHARATAARVSWRSGPDGELLTIDDNGQAGGPPPNVLELARRSDSGRGNGLIGMRERAAACGGTLAVAAGPLGGWRVQAWLPTQQ